MWLALSQIRSSDVGRRIKAIEDLGQSSDLKAMLALIGALADASPRVRIAAAAAIGRRRDERCVQPLLGALQDPHAGVREAVIEALKSIGHASAIPYLAPLLGDDAPSVRAHAAHALRWFNWAPKSDEERIIFHIATGKFSKAAEVGLGALEPLLALIGDEFGSTRRAIVEALADFDDPRAAAAIEGRLQDPDNGVVLSALSALGRRHDPSHTNAVAALLSHPDKNIRAATVEALTKLGSPGLFDLLVKAMSDDHWNVRAAAAAALGALGDARAIGPLTAALREADGDVRQVVAEAIGRLRDHSAIESLVLAQLDPDSSVRQATLAALGRIDPTWEKSESAQRTMPQLKRALRDNDYGVRQTAADLLNRIFNIRQCEPSLLEEVDAESVRRQRAVDVLASMLWDDDTLIRFAGIWALHQIGETRAAGPVSAKVRDPEPCVREAAQRALADFRATESARGQGGRAYLSTEEWGTGPVA